MPGSFATADQADPTMVPPPEAATPPAAVSLVPAVAAEPSSPVMEEGERVQPAPRPQKRKLPPRRVSGDSYVIEGPSADGGVENYHPHAGEWVEFMGSMTGEAYLRSLDAQKLRAREQEIRGLLESVRSAVDESKADSELTPAERDVIRRAEAELTEIMVELERTMQDSFQVVASLIHRLAWTDERGDPVGTPTGEKDAESGLPICTVSPADISRLPMADIGFFSSHAYGAMEPGEREGNSGG